jgi:hypothetical protein
VSVTPSARKSAKRGTISAVAGIINATTDAATTTAVTRRDSPVRAKPAKEATRTESGATSPATSSEFSAYRARSSRSKARS